jgi:hypothetical protein
MTDDEPLLTRRPWTAALLLGSAATPPAVILAVPAPWPLDALLAWPLVVADRWAASSPAQLTQVLALVAGITLTWMFYVFLARVLVWRLGPRD